MENANSNRIEVTARCTYVGPVETFASGFTKRIIAVEWTRDGSKYPTRLAFNLKKNDVNRIDESVKGHEIKVTAYVESREWTNPKNGKLQYFTELTAVKVEAPDVESRIAPEPAEPENEPAELAVDEMPF